MTGTPENRPPASPVSREEGAVFGPPVQEDGLDQDGGAALWDFLRSFIAARRIFLAIYRRYEERVLSSALEQKARREHLVLPPSGLFELFNLRRLTFLCEVRLKPLRDMAERIFGAREDEELLDVYCSHIYHELSILTEEHRSVGRFVRIKDRRRYRQLFEEVSGSYPTRLKRIRRLFTGGLRRIEVLLPKWAEHRVIVRSVYLFGDRLSLHAYGKGLSALYGRMYPEGGEIAGYLDAARSFVGSGFVMRAREAAQSGVEVAERLGARRPLDRAEAHSAREVRALLERLDEEAGVKASA